MQSLIDAVRNVYGGVRSRFAGYKEETDLGGDTTSETALPSEAPNSAASRASVDYTELMGGSVPCPSCKGSGRIPKELEETLVALIPVNDDRLKPKKTWMYIIAVIAGCLALATVVIFLLVPRAVYLSSSRPPIEIIDVFSHDEGHISFHFFNELNISNANYYGVKVTNTSATILSKFQPWSSDVIGSGSNATSVLVGPRTSKPRTLIFNNSVTLVGSVAVFCQAPFSRLTSLYVNMQFDISVTLEYLNHHEQATLSAVQQVCCVPSGNCTAS